MTNESNFVSTLDENGKVQRFSVSQLTTYASCSERWRLNKIARVPQAPTAWSIHGSAAHTAIEAWENDQRGGELTDADVIEIAVTDYRERGNKLFEKYPDESSWLTGGRKQGVQDLMDREEILKFQVQQYMDYARSEQDYWRVIESEREFDVELGGVMLKGFIDQVVEYADGSIAPADLKSGTKLPEAPIQLATYAIALMESGDYNNITQGDWVLLGRPATTRVKEKPVNRVMIDLTREPSAQRENLEQFYAAAVRGIEAGVFVPNAGDACRVCDVRGFCRGVGGLEASNHYKPTPVKLGATRTTESPWVS